MITEEEALCAILADVRRLPARTVSLASALGCYAAKDLQAKHSLPHFDNSAMDGYAIASSSSAVGARLLVTGEQPAGRDRALTLSTGGAIRIFTGAPMPTGADAVVMQEDVTIEGNAIVLPSATEPGEFVRRRGGDVAEGQKILTEGDRIRPQTLALLAAQGIGEIGVGASVNVTILTTGDELAPPGKELLPGQIYESNAAMLSALLNQCGVTDVKTTPCADDAAKTEAAVQDGAASDVLIITGGVSVGAHDFVKGALKAAGAKIELWRVLVKPGKPFLFGRIGNCFIFGLPGNPVSAFVTFLLFVRPALLRMMGAAAKLLALPQFEAVLTEPLQNHGDRPHYLRGVLALGVFTPIGRQESHALFGLSQSNALLRIPPGAQMARDSRVSVLTWEGQ